METSPTSSKRKLGVAAVIVAMVMGVAGVVAAQTGPTSACQGDSVVEFGSQFFGLEDGGNRLLSTSPTTREYPASLAAGTYSLDAVSYDGYEARETIAAQTQEQWFAEFLASDGSVLATSAITPDLADGVTEDTWTGSLGEVTLAAPASSVRVSHAAPGSNSVNSVRPVCLGASNTAAPAPAVTNPDPAAPAPAPSNDAAPSSVTVDFVTSSPTATFVSLTCGALSESAIGTEANLIITEIPGATGCVVEYPASQDCTTLVDPQSVIGVSLPGVQNILIPVAGDANVSVTINCVEPQVAGIVETPTTTAPVAAAPTTTAAPVAIAPPTTTAPVAAAPTTTAAPVAAAPTTTAAPAAVDAADAAPTATAQTGQPAFTG